MEILDRISRIVRAKADGVLGQFENDPSVVDQTIVDAKKELAQLKATAAPIYAAEKKAKEELAEYQQKAKSYMSVAEKAVMADNDADAQEALNKSAEYEKKAKRQEGVVASQVTSANALRKKIDKMIDDISEMEDAAALIKADIANAKAAKASATLTSESSKGTFERIGARAAAKRAEAEALADMDAEPEKDDLLDKYGASEGAVSLADLKARLGK